MTPRILACISLLVGGALAGCTSSSTGVVCSFESPAVLATSTWPKFRHDLQNTGTVSNTMVAENTGQLRWVFPAASDTPPTKGPFAASPVLGTSTNPSRVYIGSTDGYVYALSSEDGVQDSTFYFVSQAPITSTALVTQRFGADALFFGGGDGLLYGIDSAGNPQPTNWPTAISGFLSSSPTITTVDGTVYAASLSGFITASCPNGVGRFAISVNGVQSSPAVGADSTLYYGGDDRQLRAFATDGAVIWSFSASAPIFGAPVVAVANGVTTAIYVADRGGLLFKVNINGQPVSGFAFSGPNGGPVGPMQSSPALATDPDDPTTPRLYVGSDDGNLYAVDGNTGSVVWAFPTQGSIVSSPAVATGGAAPVIVVGSNDGNVYFVLDQGVSPVQMAAFAIGASVRSSPAIDTNGTVYVGADDGRVYAIY
jgi:outer membrane protein assembly factor BamB